MVTTQLDYVVLKMFFGYIQTCPRVKDTEAYQEIIRMNCEAFCEI